MDQNKYPQEQLDLLSGITDVGAMRVLLADLHDDLRGKVARFRYLSDLGMQLGSYGTMLYGGHVTYNAWTEARSSFVHGNSLATILLCQSLAENLLAAFLHLGPSELPRRVTFDETLRRAKDAGLLTDDDVRDLKKLAGIRNPLTHFRDVEDEQNLVRRSMTTGELADDILKNDASFAISLAARLLSKKVFRVDSSER